MPGFFRLIIILLVIWLIYRLYQGVKRQLEQRQEHNQKPTKPGNAGNAKAESIVRCQHCGLHVPVSEALQSNNKYYCCQEHLEEDQQ